MQSPSQRSLGIILAVHYYTLLRGTINLVCHCPQAFYKQPKIIAFLYSRTLLLPTITDIFKGAPSLWPHTSFLTLLIGLDNIFAAFLRYAQLIIVSSLSYYVLVVNNINESCLARLAYHSSIFQKNYFSICPDLNDLTEHMGNVLVSVQ